MPTVGPSPKSKVGITHFQLFCKFMVGRVPEKWGRCQVEQVSCGYFKSINPPLFGEGPTVGITDSGKIWHNNWGWGVGKVIGRAPPSGQCLPCFAEQLGSCLFVPGGQPTTKCIIRGMGASLAAADGVAGIFIILPRTGLARSVPRSVAF